MRSTSSPLAGRILRGLLIGVVAGVATLGMGRIWPDFLAGAKTVSTQVFDPVGQVFLRMLFFVVVPLVFSLLAVSPVCCCTFSER